MTQEYTVASIQNQEQFNSFVAAIRADERKAMARGLTTDKGGFIARGEICQVCQRKLRFNCLSCPIRKAAGL